MIYNVKIEEIYSKVLYVEADSGDIAERKIRDGYFYGKYMLNHKDLDRVLINCIGEFNR